LSTGATARAALGAERSQKSRKLIGNLAIWGHSTDWNSVDDHIKTTRTKQLCDAHPQCGIFELVRRKPVEFIGRDNKNKFCRI
jgi:hypothetical protein